MSHRSPISLVTTLLVAVFVFTGPTPAVLGSDTEPDEADVKEVIEQPDETEKPKKKEQDPFAIPENASPSELVAFIASAKKKRGRKVSTVMKSATAVADAADQLFDHVDADDQQRILAVKEQLSALGFVSRIDPSLKKRMNKLIKRLLENDNAEIASIARKERFKSRVSSATTASPEKIQSLMDELESLVQDHGFDREMYSIAGGLARYVGYSKSPELAADLSERIASWMEACDDEALAKRAPTMIGAARRFRLPGQFMDVFGSTTDGQKFDWATYRGKVVLVDFWASWCGPCRAELPNMKRNLERFGDSGFAIVGINMDRTLEACESCVESEGISWPNLVSEDEEDNGWQNPMATHYGVTGIPTAILVDQDGKVVSLRARGKELDRLLEEMLGEPEETDEGKDADTESDDQAREDEASDE